MPTGSVKTPEEIEAMRQGGRILATVLELMRQKCVAGVTPKQMAQLAAQELKRLGGEPAFLGYPGHRSPYPDIICISVNDCVQHSIPDDRPFVDGDVVNFDFGVRYKGLVTDGGLTVCVGNKTTSDTARLIEGTKQALYDGLKVIRHGCHVGDISATIERTLRKHRLGIVRELVGHGVGYELHEDGPEIPNYGKAGTGPVLRAGMTIAVEPITTLGSPAIIEDADGWTLRTADGSWSAQFEHTVLVTSSGCEILTRI
ncbi:type I methionyl aminopeptidase [Candidatus Saccharibacteria bacterium]|jgi:methionine aminopeptidase, type I|nr:type I methionyl aminopeptidase [Candidatus Saccharibacteria bacterium]